MAVSLYKSESCEIERSVKMAAVILTWETSGAPGRRPPDLDAEAFMLGAGGKVLDESDFVFYNNLRSRNEAVVHCGDIITGGQERILLDFAAVPREIQKIAVTVSVDRADAFGQNFGQVTSASVRVARALDRDDADGEIVVQFDLKEEFPAYTAMLVCEIVRSGAGWKFCAMARGFYGGLPELCAYYGVEIL